MGDAIVGFGNSFDEGPDLAAFGNEVVVRITRSAVSCVSYVTVAIVFLQ
jgi:hypothetical protein